MDKYAKVRAKESNKWRKNRDDTKLKEGFESKYIINLGEKYNLFIHK